MVPKQLLELLDGFRAVLFRMVPKPVLDNWNALTRFRAVLFRMVPKPS